MSTIPLKSLLIAILLTCISAFADSSNTTDTKEAELKSISAVQAAYAQIQSNEEVEVVFFRDGKQHKKIFKIK
jgi:hypothetical protein